MEHGLHDLARHNAWATAQVLACCQGLDAPTLATTVPGTYGTIIETLRHLIDSEMSYVFRLTGAWSARPWQADEPVGLDVLVERAAVLATGTASGWGRRAATRARSSPSGPGCS